ncbi:MAG: hypothetical protein KatS3mg077_2608 [Candidatus Binatia bacterium]|nr:MAG: hypothetical protein KatS3mg077_2608 [Candidatus Binatia bacterium]
MTRGAELPDSETTLAVVDESPPPASEAEAEEDLARFNPVQLASIIESLLFAAGAPVPLRRLVEVLDGPTTTQVREALEILREQYAPGKRGIQLVEVAGGYQLRTAREHAVWVQALLREKPQRLGRATLETLAIVAYKQPVTKAEIEAIRGVDCDGPLNTLLNRRLIKIAGRKETIGRPLLYATTSEFLEIFGLKDLNDLPALQELSGALESLGVTESAEDHAVSQQEVLPLVERSEECGAQTPEGFESAPATPAEDFGASGPSFAPPGGTMDSGGASAGERPGGDRTREQG